MADVRLTATNPEDSSVVPVACDASGRLLLEEQGQGPPGPEGPQGPKGDDGKDGDPFTGNFDGPVTFTGNAQIGGAASGGAAPGVWLDNAGYVATAKSDSNDAVFRAFTSPSNRETVAITAGGAATFNGRVSAPDFTTSDAEDFYLAGNYQQGSTGSSRGAGIFRLTDTDGTHGVQAAIRITQNGNQPTNSTCKINYDGSVDLAGGKAGFTPEGYLWCTTRRGDTVILDATSNGLATWAEFSPPSRTQQIKDKLDQISNENPDTDADTR